MLHRIYGTIIIVGILGVVGWFAYQYYVETQNAIRQPTSNNAKLEAKKYYEESIAQRWQPILY